VPFYFVNLLPTSLLYISKLLRPCAILVARGVGGQRESERDIAEGRFAERESYTKRLDQERKSITGVQAPHYHKYKY
jgi:hypothetical protein